MIGRGDKEEDAEGLFGGFSSVASRCLLGERCLTCGLCEVEGQGGGFPRLYSSYYIIEFLDYME